MKDGVMKKKARHGLSVLTRTTCEDVGGSTADSECMTALSFSAISHLLAGDYGMRRRRLGSVFLPSFSLNSRAAKLDFSRGPRRGPVDEPPSLLSAESQEGANTQANA